MGRVMVIGAHPDDEIYGVGGTIAKYVQNGHQVYVLIITEGCSSQYSDKNIISVKNKEAQKANEILGVEELILNDFPDMKLDTISHIEINRIIEEKVKLIRPETVFTHYFGDINLDHRLIYDSTVVACRNAENLKKLVCYEVPSSTEWGSYSYHFKSFNPNYFIDIEQTISLKLDALKMYKTEIRQFPHPRSEEFVKILAKYRGSTVGLNYAEAFHIIKEIE